MRTAGNDGTVRRIGTMRFYYFNSSHWDREWYLPFERFRIKLIELVLQILDRLESVCRRRKSLR